MNHPSSPSGSLPRPNIAAWVGLDWADQQHQVCLYDVATSQVESSRLEQSAEALQEWLGQLRARYGGAKVAIVLEQSRGPVLYGLMSCDFVVLYPVNPESLANYRKAFFPSGAKCDPSDAALLMEMVRKNPERFRLWMPGDAETRSLQLLTEGRRKLVNQKTSLTNQLTSLLKGYYPQALEWAGELDSEQACDFLEKWPTLADLQKAKPARLRPLRAASSGPAGATPAANPTSAAAHLGSGRGAVRFHDGAGPSRSAPAFVGGHRTVRSTDCPAFPQASRSSPV
jgi:transposase